MRNTLRLLVLALVIGPAFSPADKKTDDNLAEIQRDVAQLAEKVDALQKAQGANLEAMKQIVQQAVTASNQVTQDMAALQRTLTTSIAASLNDQQGKVAGAVTPLATQMAALAGSVDALNQTVTQMNRKFDALDTRFKDLTDKVSDLNKPLPTPPPSAVVAPSAAPDPNTPPPGVSRLSLWQEAQGDYASARDDMALKEFADFIRYFHDDAYAPQAGIDIGMIYARQKEYDMAVDAFQHVIDTWPGMNTSQDALYQKAKALASGGHKADAIAAYKEFMNSYPTNDYYPLAKAELAKLQAPAAGARGRGGKGPAK